MGFKIEFDTGKLDRIAREYTKRGGKMAELLPQVGEYMERTVFDRIGAKEDWRGQPFKELSPDYKRSKKKNRDRILVATGRMVDSLTYDIVESGKELRVGFGDKKARYHMSSEPRSKIPERNPLGISQKDKREIEKLANEIYQL